MFSSLDIYNSDGKLSFSSQASLMHLVKVGKPIFYKKERFLLAGSYANGQLSFIDQNRYYYEIYYIDIPNGVAPVCAAYKGALVFIKNQKLPNSNIVRMWFYTTPWEAPSYTTLDDCILYIYDVYDNQLINPKAGLKTWNQDGGLTFSSYSRPLEINHVIQFSYHPTSPNAFYSGQTEFMSHNTDNLRRYHPYQPQRSTIRQLSGGRKYATIIPSPLVKKMHKKSISTEYYLESYMGLDGGAVAFFLLDIYTARSGLAKYHAQKTGHSPTNFGNVVLTQTPSIMCIDVTELPIAFN